MDVNKLEKWKTYIFSRTNSRFDSAPITYLGTVADQPDLYYFYDGDFKKDDPDTASVLWKSQIMHLPENKVNKWIHEAAP